MTTALETPADALRLAWWATAWLRGQVVTDLMLDAVIGDDATHTLLGLAELGLGGEPGGSEGLVSGLGRLRAEGATSLGTAFPAEGDPIGLGGPRDFTTAAIEAGAGIVSDAGVGLVPERVGAVIGWRAYRADRRQLPDVVEADRMLRTTLLESAQALADLDVARWRPEVADALMDLRHRPSYAAPPGVPERCVDLAARGQQAADIVALALGAPAGGERSDRRPDDGAAVSATEMTARRDALLPLDRAARRALTAAGSPEVWPPA